MRRSWETEATALLMERQRQVQLRMVVWMVMKVTWVTTPLRPTMTTRTKLAQRETSRLGTVQTETIHIKR